MAAWEGIDVLQQLLDQVHVGHNHAAAAVPLEAELVHRVSVASFVLANMVARDHAVRL